MSEACAPSFPESKVMTKLKQGSTVELNSLVLQIASINPPQTRGLQENQLEEADDDEAEGSE